MFKELSWDRKTFAPDITTGLTVTLFSIPEGMAYALVAGVDPIYGLYTGMVTTIVATLTGNTLTSQACRHVLRRATDHLCLE